MDKKIEEFKKMEKRITGIIKITRGSNNIVYVGRMANIYASLTNFVNRNIDDNTELQQLLVERSQSFFSDREQSRVNQSLEMIGQFGTVPKGIKKVILTPGDRLEKDKQLLNVLGAIRNKLNMMSAEAH